ncbi:MAG: hypothetical protein RR405_03075 [Clostridia bacterium]
MDFLFPDDDAIKKMSKEYATLKKNAESIAKACGNENSMLYCKDKSKACGNENSMLYDKERAKLCEKEAKVSGKNGENACGNANLSPDDIAQNNLATYSNGCGRGVVAPLILLLYFMFGLRYNSTYEHAFYDTDRGVGRVQPSEGTLGNINNFFDRRR